jgi:hypothetical protein
VTATAVAACGTVAATEVVSDHPSHKTDRAPRQATSPTHRSSLPVRSEQSVPVGVRRQPDGRGTLDRPARRKHDPAAEKRPPGAASSPSHVSRPERARGGGRPDRPAPPAGKKPKPAVKTPTRRQVGHTRPQPPKSQGKAKGHENEPKGPKPVTTPAPAPPVTTPELPPQAGNGHK